MIKKPLIFPATSQPKSLMAALSGASIACNLPNLTSCKTTPMAALFPVHDIMGPRLNLSLRPRQLHSFATILSKSMTMGHAMQSARFAGVAFATAVADKSIHDFTVTDIDGKEVPLSNYKGKVLLAVNVASRCGLTNSNYTELSHLYEKYKTQGFEILAFPCNQFGAQEPGKNEEIKEFACTKFKAEFPIFDKVEVNGPNTAPVYKFLKSSKGGLLGDIIKWNFEKFLINRDGKVVERYPPTTSPFQIEKDIQKLLAA